ncbi:hypothetical protein MMC30_009311 [Trapelia coarctata]|nr:hypothetical protein [Trapelia coarctata]
MDPISVLGVTASLAGIISLGISISQIMQKQIDDMRNADQRLLQIVFEIQGTAAALADLQNLLLEDESRPQSKILNANGQKNVLVLVTQCNVIFRNIIVLLAKADKAVLAQVDEFQRAVSKQGSIKAEKEATLDIEMSTIEHLVWPWRLPKIAQYMADLQNLTQVIRLSLDVAALGKREKLGTEDSDSSTRFEDEDDCSLVDAVYYRHLAAQEAERASARASIAVTKESYEASPGDTIRAAYELVQNWPNLPHDGGVPSALEVRQLGIILESYALAVPKAWEANVACTSIPVPSRTVYEQALRSVEKKKGTDSVFNTFTRLPAYQQRVVQSCLNNLPAPREPCSERPTLIGLEISRRRGRRLIDRFKSFTPYYGHSPPRCDLIIFVAWTPVVPDLGDERAGGPSRFPYDGRGTSSQNYDHPDDDRASLAEIGNRRHLSYGAIQYGDGDVFTVPRRQGTINREDFENDNHSPLLRTRNTNASEHSNPSHVRFSRTNSRDTQDETTHRTNSWRLDDESRSFNPRPGRSFGPSRSWGTEDPESRFSRPDRVGTDETGRIITIAGSHTPSFASRHREGSYLPLASSNRSRSFRDDADALLDAFPPSEEVKISIAEYYLRAWTTASEGERGRFREKLRDRHDSFDGGGKSEPEYFRPRPRGVRIPSPPIFPERPRPRGRTEPEAFDHPSESAPGGPTSGERVRPDEPVRRREEAREARSVHSLGDSHSGTTAAPGNSLQGGDADDGSNGTDGE